MKIHRNPIEEAFTAKSKESGRVVNFSSQQNRDDAVKSGEYEETDDAGGEPAAAKPKVNIFDKPKPQAQPTSDTDGGGDKPSSMVAPPVVKTPVDVLKGKVEKWSEKEKAFFRDGIHKQDSPERRNWKQAITDKAKGAIAAIKKGAKHEVEEFKTAGVGVKNFFSGKELSEHEKKAVKAVAIKVATTALFGALTGGAGHGALAFGKHVALEFIPHVVGETILKGAGTAALFAGDEDEDVYMERFMAIIADKMASEKITPELMNQMVDSYNAKKGEAEPVTEAVMNPVKKLVNAILKKHKVDAMKTTSTSVRGFHDIKNGGYKYDGDYFLQFYKVPQNTIEKIAAEMKKAGVKGVQVNMGNISADYTKTGLSNSQFESVNEESELKGYLAADVVDDIVKAIGSKMVKGHVENAPNRNYIYLKLTDIKFGNDVVKMLKSKFGIDSKIDKTFGNIPTVSFASKKVINESVTEEISQLTPDQNEMVNGIIEMLLQIKDIDNRMEVAQQQIQNFKDEGIDFNYAGFLSAAGLDNNDEPIRMNTKTMPQHILNKESIMNEEFKHLIHVDTPTQVVSKPVAAQIMALAKKGVRSKDIGLEMGFVGNQKMATDAFQKVKNKIYFELGKKFEAVNVKVDGTEQESSEETLESLNKMAMGDLERIEDYAEMISDRMKEGQELSAWMYSQITLAVDQLNSVHDTMDGKDGVKESVNEAASRTAMEIGALTGTNKDFIQSFVDKHNLDIEKVFQYVKKGKLKDRMDFVTAVVGKDNNPYQTKLIKQFKESVNEAKYPTDLKVGSVIMGQGFTMLKGIEGGKYYKVVSVDDISATLVPSDRIGNVKGSTKVRHKLDSIEGGIKTAKRGDENGIVVIKESTEASDIVKDLDKVRTDLIKKVDVLIAKKKKLYSDVDITTPMSADEKQLDKDIQSIFSQIQQIIQQKRKIVKESVNEGKYYVSYNKGRGQGKGLSMEFDKKTFKPLDKPKVFNSYKDAKKYADDMEKVFRNSIGGGTAYWVSDEKMNPIKESVNEAMGNDKSMLALVDVLSNSMEYYDESDFLQAVRGGQGWSGIPGFKNSSLIPVFKSIYKKYWTVSPQNRTNWITKDWINWLKPFGLEENVNSETDTIEEIKLNEKQFKGLEDIPSNTSLEKISKDQKLKIIKAPGNIIDFIVPKGVSRNFWQVIGTGKIQKNSGGNYVLLGKVIHSPAFKSMDDLIDGVNWKSMENRRRFNESVTESTPGEQIQNLNNRLTKLRQDMAKAKSPEAKNVIQAKMKNALQKLSNKKKELGIKKP